jgi:hypothetical protein
MNNPKISEDPRAAILRAIDASLKRFATDGWPFVEQTVTEGRFRFGATPKHHWCGEYVQYILECAFGKLPFLNRSSLGRWRPGENLSSITTAARLAGAIETGCWGVPGDILILDRPLGGHICFQYGPHEPGKPYKTADGNGPSAGVGLNERAAADRPVACYDTAKLVNATALANGPEGRAQAPEGYALVETPLASLKAGDHYITPESLVHGRWLVR